MAQQKVSVPVRSLFQMLLLVLLPPFLPLLISGRWNWWQGWVCAIVYILSFVVSRLLAARQHPDLIAERTRFMQAQDTKAWDKVLAPLVGLGSIVVLIVAGLDKLYGWSTAFSTGINLLGLGGLLLGYAFSSWALIENRFFSGTVRIQTERDHHVISSGPYKIVRHPGYAGALLAYVFVPLLLDSAWAFVPTVILMIAMIVRTALEDKTLQAELPGYKDFTNRTKYRLVPWVW